MKPLSRGDYFFPFAAAVLACLLVVHYVTAHLGGASFSNTGTGTVTRVDTAALLAMTLPVTMPARIDDTDPNDGLTLAYEAGLTLDRNGLRYSGQSGLTNWFGHRLDSTFVGYAAQEGMTLALAEPAPWGWRIAKAGERYPPEEWGPGSMSYRPAGSEMNLVPDTLLIPGVTALDLIGRWPVIINDIVIKDPETEEVTRIQVVARGDRTLFERLIAPKLWEDVK